MNDASAADGAGNELPTVLAGPILRHLSRRQVVLWLVGSQPLSIRLKLSAGEQPLLDQVLDDEQVHRIPLGRQVHIHLINVALDFDLPTGERVDYDLGVQSDLENQRGEGATETWIADWAPHLCLPGAKSPNFVLKDRLTRILHGSCRRPHHPAADGLARVDREIETTQNHLEERPGLLLMTGDQIYADDVAGPMLRAIHRLIERLGMYEERLEGSVVENSEQLRNHPNTYYHRQDLLPENKANEAVIERFLGGVRKPVFTTANARNHLISLSETIAMYLLVWSPVCWRLVELDPPDLTPGEAAQFQRERECIHAFVATMPQAARAMAHLPCYMIFDDHDITDDWNLSADWEATAYEHPLSRRIIGNALIAYLLCQGWGNKPAAFGEILPLLKSLLDPPDLLDSREQNPYLNNNAHEQIIDRLLAFSDWGYCLSTTPPVVVMDTRTRRWRSEISRSRPSGLMDWEALMDLQQDLVGKETVIMVSATPMFGVKLIEVIQRIFTFFGRPLVVDAENWMAHGGAAYALFQIFRHSGTPENYIVLSGDVHYSFVYDVRLRHRPNSPRIWQITSSGIKNEFPHDLLEWLDRLNRWLYAPWSPLNLFTKRRRMRVSPRLPTAREAGERLWNMSGIGLVVLDEQGVPAEIRQLGATGEDAQFLKRVTGKRTKGGGRETRSRGEKNAE